MKVTITDLNGTTEVFTGTTREDEGATADDRVAVFDRGATTERHVSLSTHWIDTQP